MWSGPKGAQAGDGGHREGLCLEDSKAFTWGLAPFPSPLAPATLRPAVSVPTACPGQACHLPSHSSLHSCPCAGVLGSPHSAGMGVEPLGPGHMPNPGGRLGSKMLEIGSGVHMHGAWTQAHACPGGVPHLPRSALHCVSRCSRQMERNLALAASPSPPSGASETPGAWSHSSHGQTEGH